MHSSQVDDLIEAKPKILQCITETSFSHYYWISSISWGKNTHTQTIRMENETKQKIAKISEQMNLTFGWKPNANKKQTKKILCDILFKRRWIQMWTKMCILIKNVNIRQKRKKPEEKKTHD